MRLCTFVVLTLCLACIDHAQATTVDTLDVRVHATDRVFPSAPNQDNSVFVTGVALPSAGTVQADPGSPDSVASWDLQSSTFRLSNRSYINYRYTGPYDSSTQQEAEASDRVIFRVDQPTNYDVTRYLYQFTSNPARPIHHDIVAYLRNLDTGELLFGRTLTFDNDSFTIGRDHGLWGSSGSPTGLLLPGNRYSLELYHGVHHVNGQDTFGASLHELDLQLTPVLAPVPEPSTLILGLVSFVGAAVARRRRRGA